MKRKSVVVNVAPWEPYREQLRAALVVREQLLDEEVARLTAQGKTPNRRVRKALRRFRGLRLHLKREDESAQRQEELRRPELEAFGRRVKAADRAHAAQRRAALEAFGIEGRPRLNDPWLSEKESWLSEWLEQQREKS